MPRDVSSSSSEDEANKPATPREAGRNSSLYQCPADFVPFCHKPCSSTLAESLERSHREIWLIKAPSSFNPECLRGVKVPLSGLQSFKVPTRGDQQIYNILASPHCTSELRLLTRNSHSSSGMVFSQTFSGLLNVCESFGDCSVSHDPQVIPAAPAPSIPPGLRQRFQPFGSKTPMLACRAETEADARVRHLVVERCVEDARRKEEGSKKKEKRMKLEQQEDEVVQEEPVCSIQDEARMDIHMLEEKRRKKKRRRSRKDRKRADEVEEGAEASVTVKAEDVMVKYEPVNTSYGDVVEECGKKKKRKKDREREEEETEASTRVKTEDVMVKHEPVDTSYGDVVEESVKKRRRRKKQN